MSASNSQSSYSCTKEAGSTFRSNDTRPSSTATAFTEGSATAAGHGDHPRDTVDDSNITMPGTRVGPQIEDLEGMKMAPPGERQVMDAQSNKKNAGWGEEESLTSHLERQKAEQQDAREQIRSERMSGTNVDGGAGSRIEDEGIDDV
jgi:hypothetical protein